MDVEIRAYADKDAPALAALTTIGYAADPDLGGMVGGLFDRPDEDGPRWSRRLVAVLHGQLVGAAAARASSHHPGEAPCVVVVLPTVRRAGVGTALLSALLHAVAPLDPPPLFGTLAGDPAGRAFAAARGFRPISGYSIRRLDPNRGECQDFAAAHPLAGLPLAEADDEQVVDAIADLLRWAHVGQPISGDTPREVIVSDRLPQVVRDAGILVYDPPEDGALVGFGQLADLGGPTLALMCGADPARPDRAELLAGVFGAMLRHSAGRGKKVDVELLLDDPLAPLLADLPGRTITERLVVRQG